MVLSSAYTSISSFNPHTKEGTLQHGGIAVTWPQVTQAAKAELGREAGRQPRGSPS